MPGAYAHITMAFTAASNRGLDMLGLDLSWKSPLAKASQYFMLGAVSPDMPYLDILGGEKAKAWADCMHLKNVAERIRAGVAAVVDLPRASQAKALAWLLGFVEHVVFDVYMHPLVNIIAGGPYGPETKDKHAECEMHQDVYIVKEKFGIGSALDGEIISTMLSTCNLKFEDGKLDADIASVWMAMMSASCQKLYSEDKPDIGDWYEAFMTIMKMLETADVLVSLARHIAKKKIYPKFSGVNHYFINGLKTPGDKVIDYELAFDTARSKVIDFWKIIATAVVSGQKIDCRQMAGWNLDTGKDGSENFVFWG